MSKPKLPSVHMAEYIHPSFRIPMIRGRGDYWWKNGQVLLETEMDSGRVLNVGTFYYFLKDKFSIGGENGNFLYGNIYMGDHWITHSAALPEGVEDAPYKMVDVSVNWQVDITGGWVRSE